jgi:hypothetical protein
LFPVLWVDEGLELNDQMTDKIKSDLVNVLLTLDIVQWALGERRNFQINSFNFNQLFLKYFSGYWCTLNCGITHMVLHSEKKIIKNIINRSDN